VKLLLSVLLVYVSFAAIARTDAVTLKNGDRITGTLVTIKGGNLELKSDVFGDLTIPLAQIASFSAEKPAAVMVKGEKPLQGRSSWSPRATRKGGASLSYTVQRGDQQTSNFTTAVAATRDRPETPTFLRHWRTNYGLTMVFSHAAQNDISVTSNTFSTGLRQDYLFAPNDFLFGLVQFDHIGAQGLYLRQAYGGGYGHDVIKTRRTLFSVLRGITSVHEKFFTGDYNRGAAALLGERLVIKLAKLVRFDNNVNFYPTLSNSGQYRYETATTLSAKLSNRFSVNAGVIDFYLSNPAPGSHKNNLAFTTGLGYTF